MKKFRLITGLLIMTLTAAACGTDGGGEEASGQASGSTDGNKEKEEVQAEELTIEHDLGETTVEKNPEEVVVFDFGSLDTLDTLGVDVTGVPQANIPTYLEKYESADYENVGGLKEPDFEKIAEIDPELIIISGRQSDAYDEFSKIAPTIFLQVDTKDYMNSFEENVMTLAEIFEKEDEADEKLTEVKEKVAALQEKTSDMEEEALIILASDGKVSAYGSESRFGLIHDEFGFPESDENIEASIHGQSVSFEYIAEQNPDYLFIVDRGAVVGDGGSSAKEVVENDLTKNTEAYKNDNFIYLDPNYWYLSGGGLLSVSEMVEEVEGALE
ncbi:siderophore ABC transporter substrate-binding protein [Bacillus piscicola]|uniref:siderophore ABC transporter substrate-binding protein n=1 Tax=Bacillus piscicola TaxID=1632684 RepID=UPI001F09EF43|nr:siderophore ABC transporter substrate-binding protein [Bacillus piscicola]